MGCITGRMDGGGVIKTPELIERLLVMCGFVLALAPSSGIYSLGALLGIAGIATGHGQYFLSRAIKAIKPEFFDILIQTLFGPDPRCDTSFKPIRGIELDPQGLAYSAVACAMRRYGIKRLYWRNVFGMFITGLIVGFPAFIIGMVFSSPYSCLFLFTSVAKALAYMISYKLNGRTELAEYINGGLRNLICLLVILGEL